MPRPTGSPRRRQPVVAALLVTAPLMAALVPFALAPRTSAGIAARVAATALGPVVALSAIVLGVSAWRLAGGATVLRRVLAAATALTVGLALLPGVAALVATRRGLAAIGQLGPAHPLGGSGQVTVRAVPYAAADGTPLQARLFADASCERQPCPMVAVFYGGAWRSGDASQAASVNRRIAGLGTIVVALDYRHAPAARYPAQRDDVRRGLALLADSAAAWHGDPSRVVLWGRSSGAHLAMLGGWDPAATDLRLGVRGVIDFYGPYDLAEGYRDLPSPDPLDVRAILRAFVGGAPDALPEAYRAASPATYVRPGLPPSLLVYAAADHIVLARFGRRAAAALGAAGNRAVYVELPSLEHGFDFATLGVPAFLATRLVTGFLEHIF